MASVANARVNVKAHHDNQGNSYIVESGGDQTILGGGTLDVQAGATVWLLDTVALTAKTADLNQLTGRQIRKIAKVAVAGGTDTAGGLFAWANPEAGSILVVGVTLDVATVASGACTVDIGTTAASATTLSDTLLDGVDAHAGVATFGTGNVAGLGTNGVVPQKLATGKWVTGSTASGLSAGLAGNVYIEYVSA